MFYVYEHRRLDTNQLFYIGKGRGNRAYSTKDRSNEWQKVCADAKGRKVEIIFQCNDEAVVLAYETFLIKTALIWGESLVNKTHGGEGKSGVNRTKAQKEHLRKLNLGKKHTDLTKTNLSKRFQNKFWAQKHLQASIAKSSTPEALALHKKKQKKQCIPVVGTNVETGEEIFLESMSQDARFDPGLIKKTILGKNGRTQHKGYKWRFAFNSNSNL